MNRNDTHEFRPILQEIEERPPNPLAGVTFWLVILVFFSLVAWTILGEIDVVVSAPGKVIPVGQVKTVQPLDTGVVSKILVQEGDQVKKGQILMEIDPSSTKAEVESSAKNLRYARLESNRLVANLGGQAFSPAGGQLDPDAFTQAQLFAANRRNLEKQLSAKQFELKKIGQQYAATNLHKEENQKLLGIAEEKKERLEKVRDIIPREDYEKAVNDITSHKSTIEQDVCKLQESQHETSRISEEVEQIQATFQENNLKELSDRQKQVNDLSAKYEESYFKNSKQAVVSPVDGYIDTSYLHTIGGVVTPAEKLFTIVPANAPLVIEAYVENKDIGFIKQGLPVAIKVDAFDFQKYGLYEGFVKMVSADSHEDEKQKENKTQTFNVYVTPTTKSLVVENKKRSLQSGMSVVAEIKVGKRRIIEFFLYPVLKHMHEGFSVR
jgi:hemolysin D